MSWVVRFQVANYTSLHPSEFHQRLIKLAEIVLVLLIAVGILLSKPAIAKDASITAFVDVNVTDESDLPLLVPNRYHSSQIPVTYS